MIELPRSVEDRLQHDQRVWLGTLRIRDGSPHLTPVWFVYRPGRWWVGADAGSVKVRNLEHDSRASLALEDGVNPVVAEGTARVHRGGFDADILQRFAAKYDGWQAAEPTAPDRPRALIEIEVTRWLLAGVAQ